MKSNAPPLLRSYSTALRKYLNGGPNASLTGARRQGTCAVAAGMQILDLARVHEEALRPLLLQRELAFQSDRIVRRADPFFAEAVIPIEETHRSALETNDSLQQAVETLRLRTAQLAASNEELQHEIVERNAVEASLRTSELTTSQLLKKSLEMQEQLRHLSRRLFSIQEKERCRISRDLHDVIVQTLAGINVRLAALKTQNASSSKGLQNKIEATQRLVARSVEMIHRFARDLRPTMLDDLGLNPALEHYLKEFIKQTGIRVRLTSFAAVETFHEDVLTALFRIIQEALTNVSRHAKASDAHIIMKHQKGAIRMEIHDNGSGFVITPDACPKNGRRLGLLGVRERIEMLGGSFHVESVLGEGTKLFFELPPHPPKSVKRAPKRGIQSHRT